MHIDWIFNTIPLFPLCIFRIVYSFTSNFCLYSHFLILSMPDYPHKMT